MVDILNVVVLLEVLNEKIHFLDIVLVGKLNVGRGDLVLLCRLDGVACRLKCFLNSIKIIDLGVEYDIIKKSGSWFSYGENKLAQGREAVKQLLTDNVELCEEIEAKIREVLQNVQD